MILAMQLMELVDNNYGSMGWIVAIVLGAFGLLDKGWNYLIKRSSDSTKIELNKSDIYKTNQKELNEQYQELLNKFEEMEMKFEKASHQLDKALSTFKVIIPLIESIGETNPVMKKTIDNAIKEILKEEPA